MLEEHCHISTTMQPTIGTKATAHPFGRDATGRGFTPGRIHPSSVWTSFAEGHNEKWRYEGSRIESAGEEFLGWWYDINFIYHGMTFYSYPYTIRYGTLSRKRDLKDLSWSSHLSIFQLTGGGSFWVISVACQLGIDQNWPRGGSRQGGAPPPP